MQREDFQLAAPDGQALACYRWLPDPFDSGVAIQIGHGMGEHALRYQAFADALTGAGYAVYANDHRGHGATMGDVAGYMGDDGWNRVIDDAAVLSDHIATEHPGTKLVYFGHSMGSMLGQQYLYRHGQRLSAAVLSGSPGLSAGFSTWLSRTIARFERWRLGGDAPSALLQNLLFGNSNKPFDTESATGFEWLSRDETEVARYVDDPKCGFVLTAGSLAELFEGVRDARDPANIANIPHGLPIYVMSGGADPVHAEMAGLQRLLDAYRNAGLEVTSRIYPDGRHEMLNETNREEVIADTLAWLAAHAA